MGKQDFAYTLRRLLGIILAISLMGWVKTLFVLEKSGFRYDINGLRAWAVLSVVLFHFLIPGFSGGFAGVDVFFVISGWLMTDMIVSGLHQNKFRLGAFYLSRAKRIFPALIVLVLVLLGIGWLVLPTPDYQELGSQSGYALGFISNIDFARADGYFDSAAHEKWLLHTWSLGVEWQFYILFPLFLMLVYKLVGGRLPWIFAALVGLVVSSYLYSVWLSPRAPTDAFYLLPTRAWEMAAGGVVFMLSTLKHKPKLPAWLYGLGWLFVLGTFALVSSETQWPGPWAAFAVLGTMMILLAERQENPLIRHPFAQWIGLRSYSIYLWHWPLAVFLFFIQQQEHVGWVLAMMGLSLLLGHLSYQFIENPTRTGLNKVSIKKATTCVLLSLIGSYALAAVVKESHFSGRVAPEIDAIAAEVTNTNPLRERCLANKSSGEPVGCTYGADKEDGGRLGVIVLGDSHGASVVRAMERVLPEQQYALDWTMSGCGMIRGLQVKNNWDYSCAQFIENVLARSAELPANVPVLMVSRFSQYFAGKNQAATAQAPNYYIQSPYTERSETFYSEMSDGLVAAACAFAEHRPVFMLRPIPEMPVNVPQYMSRSLLFGGSLERVNVSRSEYHKRQARVRAAQDQAAAQCGVKLLEVTDIFCDQENCWGDKNGRPMYYDDDHLSEYGADFLAPQLKRVLEQSNWGQNGR